MARLPRLAVAGQLHLLVQRGHNGKAVFAERKDRLRYLESLRHAAAAERVAVHAYGLVPSRVLLLATPEAEGGLGRMMQAVSRTFVLAYNRRHGRQGALWQGRFGCAVVDPVSHGVPCLRCVESVVDSWTEAPAEPAAVQPAGTSATSAAAIEAPDNDVSVSSAPHHQGHVVIPWLVETLAFWQLGNTPFEREANYRALPPVSRQDGNLLLQTALRGWPLAAPDFFGGLAVVPDRALAPRRRGRPAAR